MKKFISIALAALTAVGLFGCSQDNAEDVSRISELEAQVGSLEASIAALESEKNGLDSQHSDAKAENETFAGENEQLSEVLSTAEEETKRLKAESANWRLCSPKPTITSGLPSAAATRCFGTGTVCLCSTATAAWKNCKTNMLIP